MGQENNGYILELSDVSKSFFGVKALKGVSLKVKRGSVHALLGENGAGKSTVIKIVNGLYKKDSGTIIFNGNQVEPTGTKQMLDLGIATIPQELNPVMDMTVAENIYLGIEPKKGVVVDYKKMYHDAQILLDSFGFKYNPREKMRSYRISDMQLIEIAKAVSRGAKLVIMDEPTSSITESEVKFLFTQIKKLKEQGIGIIYVSHRLEEILEICDEYTVYRDGTYIGSGLVSDIDKNGLVKLMVGREINDVYPKVQADIGDVVLDVRNFTHGKTFRDVSFKVRAGEVLGVSGLVGAGRSEVLGAVYGLDKPESGEVYLNGQKLTIKKVKDALDNGIVLAPEDRRRDGLVTIQSVRLNISLMNLKKYLKCGVLSSKKEMHDVNEMVKKLSIKVANVANAASTLSGGNQQKIVLAKVLLLSPKVLILDEPTRGIDVGAKYEIYKLMNEIAAQGTAIVMISSELPEIIGMSDRVMVMSNGKMTGILDRDELTQERIMELSIEGF